MHYSELDELIRAHRENLDNFKMKIVDEMASLREHQIKED